MYASAKFAKPPVQAIRSHAFRSLGEQPYAEGSVIIAILLKRFQTEQSCAARDETPAEKLWLLAAKGRL